MTNNKMKFTLVCILSLIVIIKPVYALSVGISPSSKSIDMVEGEEAIAYFAISQGSDKDEQIDISVDVDWIEIDPDSFVLSSASQEYVKFTVGPLEKGDYNAVITASASIPGNTKVRSSVKASLEVHVTEETVEEVEESKTRASTSINNAQTAIDNLGTIGGETSSADSLLTSALEEFEKENYASAKNLADQAYVLAQTEYNNQKGTSNWVLSPIQLGLLIIFIGAAIVGGVIGFEYLKARRRELGAGAIIFKGRKCSKCGGNMKVVYDGTLVTGLACVKCNNKEIREKPFRRR